MAQITTVKVAEADSTLVLRVNMVSDGSGELINYPFLYPSNLVPPRPNSNPTFRILQIWYSLVWYDVTFSAGTLSPVTLWTLARDCDSHTDFRSFGGLLDQNVYQQPPVDDNGALLISTNGFNVAGSQGTIVLSLGKTNAP